MSLCIGIYGLPRVFDVKKRLLWLIYLFGHYLRSETVNIKFWPIKERRKCHVTIGIRTFKERDHQCLSHLWTHELLPKCLQRRIKRLASIEFYLRKQNVVQKPKLYRVFFFKSNVNDQICCNRVMTEHATHFKTHLRVCKIYTQRNITKSVQAQNPFDVSSPTIANQCTINFPRRKGTGWYSLAPYLHFNMFYVK